MELYGPCFCRIIDVGEHDGMCYYATSVNDGEFLKDYVERVVADGCAAGPVDSSFS